MHDKYMPHLGSGKKKKSWRGLGNPNFSVFS